MPTHRSVVDALIYSAQLGDPVVLATVVRVTGSSYGGVGARMVVHADGSTVGLVSGGCLESDIAEHARRVHANARAEVVSYDTRNDDDAPWGLGLGCNGLIEVLLEPLTAADGSSLASIIGHALGADSPTVLATVIVSGADTGAPAIGAHALIVGGTSQTTGDWGDGVVLANAASATDEALAAGRRGLVREYGAVEIAFEVVAPSIRLLICGSGPDVLPIATFASQLGWEVVVIDHRKVDATRPARFPGARVVECTDALKLADAVALTGRTAAVVVSHHFSRDLDYVQALLTAGVAYVGVLGPRARTQRMLAELVVRGLPPVAADGSLFAPVGLDLGGDGPEAIALAIIAEVQAIANDRAGGHLRDRRGSLHPSPPTRAAGGELSAARNHKTLTNGQLLNTKPSSPLIGAVVLAAGASTRFGSPKQLLEFDGVPLVRRAAKAAADAGAKPVVVVIGANADLVAAALSGLEFVRVVVNHDWASGLASSLTAGLHALFDDETGGDRTLEPHALDGVLVTLADQPHVESGALRIVMAGLDDDTRLVAAAYRDTIGVPAVFGREHIDELMTLKGDSGAGHWLRNHSADVRRIPLEAPALDIDVPSDAARLASDGLLLHQPPTMPDSQSWSSSDCDVAIVGGGPAGLSAALWLARYLHSVVVIDSGDPRNWEIRGINGFLGSQGIRSPELRRCGRNDAEKFGAKLIDTTVNRIANTNSEHFVLTLEDGADIATRRVLLAYGIKDEWPRIPGLRGCYGETVHVCPDCDGYETRDKKTVVIGTGRKAVGMALSLTTWTEEIVICTNGEPADIDKAELEQLKSLNIPVLEERVLRVNSDEGEIRCLDLDAGMQLDCERLYFAIGQRPADDLGGQLNCDRDEQGLIVIDDRFHTSVMNVFAAGDIVPGPQLAVAAAAGGAIAAMAIHRSLVPDKRKLD